MQQMASFHLGLAVIRYTMSRYLQGCDADLLENVYPETLRLQEESC